MSGNHGGNGATNSRSRACLTVEAVGVTMLLPDERRVVLVKGTPRVSRNDSQIVIPRHYAFIALAPGSYEENPNLPRRIGFRYDLDAPKEHLEFDAFDIAGCRVSFENVLPSLPQLATDSISPMKDFAGDGLRLRTGVADGSSDYVAAVIDFSNALTIKGLQHAGHFTGVVRFGGRQIDPAEKIAAEFDCGGGVPRIRLVNRDGMVQYIQMKNCDQPVMIGNVPFEELAEIDIFEGRQMAPLAHFEMLYDLFDISPTALRPVPMFEKPVTPGDGDDDHDMAHAPARSARAADLHDTNGTGGLCGPPIKYP
ncbi:MAG TPA: hypothetical protein VFN10_00525 [Thermoanaerobaculia bacterium]|nr:hypothetical protein [Thermoanaerobaculia bacterium]